MTRKRAKPVDQTSFAMPGTTETPRALRSPPMATGEPRRLLSSTAFQSSSGECRVKLTFYFPMETDNVERLACRCPLVERKAPNC
jgi:hypothetical protein